MTRETKCSTDSHKALIRKFLETGRPLTALLAFERWGCLRTAARIYDLVWKDGCEINTHMIKIGQKRVASYRMVLR